MKSKQFLLYLLIFLSMGAWAQKKITGKVTDFSNSETLPGVNVVIKGNTSVGTVTDMEGHYTKTSGFQGQSINNLTKIHEK